MKNSTVGLRATVFSMLFGLYLLMPLTVVGDETSFQDYTVLRQQLQDLGWRAERSSRGDLLLWPPGQQSSSPPVVVPRQTGVAVGSLIAVTDIEVLKKRLGDRGWDVRQGEDGSLLLYPDRERSAADSNPTESLSSAVEETDQLREVQALLAASGWRVERDAQGNLNLYPQPAAQEESNAKSKALLQVASSDLQRVRDALLASGWQLEEARDGSLTLYPGKAVTAADEAENTTGQRVWHPLVSEQIELPVDSWQKARKIADSWLERQPRNDLAVGKIRKINWIYLVSIVEKNKPFRLNNQLAIRNSDGRVVLLF